MIMHNTNNHTKIIMVTENIKNDKAKGEWWRAMIIRQVVYYGPVVKLLHFFLFLLATEDSAWNFKQCKVKSATENFPDRMTHIYLRNNVIVNSPLWSWMDWQQFWLLKFRTVVELPPVQWYKGSHRDPPIQADVGWQYLSPQHSKDITHKRNNKDPSRLQ